MPQTPEAHMLRLLSLGTRTGQRNDHRLHPAEDVHEARFKQITLPEVVRLSHLPSPPCHRTGGGPQALGPPALSWFPHLALAFQRALGLPVPSLRVPPRGDQDRGPLSTAREAGLRPPDSGYPLGWESLDGRAVTNEGESRATVATAGSTCQSSRHSTACSILGGISAEGYARGVRVPRDGLEEHPGSQMSFRTGRGDAGAWRAIPVVGQQALTRTPARTSPFRRCG